MRRRRKLEPAADHRAMQRRDHRRGAELHRVQRRMPHARMEHAGPGIALLELGKVQARAEMIAFAVEHDRAHRVRQVLEDVPDGEDHAVADRVALGRAREPHDGHGVVQFELEVGRGHWICGLNGLLL